MVFILACQGFARYLISKENAFLKIFSMKYYLRTDSIVTPSYTFQDPNNCRFDGRAKTSELCDDLATIFIRSNALQNEVKFPHLIVEKTNVPSAINCDDGYILDLTCGP